MRKCPGGSGPAIGGLRTVDLPDPTKGWSWVTGETWSHTSWHAGQPDTVYENRLQYWSGSHGVPEASRALVYHRRMGRRVKQAPGLAIVLSMLALVVPLSIAVGSSGEGAAAQHEGAAKTRASDGGGNEWIGRSVDDVLATWGQPNRVKTDRRGGKLLIYKIRLPGALTVPPPTVIEVAGSVPPGPGTIGPSSPVTVEIQESPRTQVTGKRKARFWVDAGGTVYRAEVRRLKWKKPARPDGRE